MEIAFLYHNFNHPDAPRPPVLRDLYYKTVSPKEQRPFFLIFGAMPKCCLIKISLAQLGLTCKNLRMV